VRFVAVNGECGSKNLAATFRSYPNTSYCSSSESRGVRPVLTLESGILKKAPGAGTIEQPIEIY